MNDSDQRRWPWSILGVDATTDPAAIKAAYAARLRVTRPDEDPEGFQGLRQARDTAIALAGKSGPSPTPTPTIEKTAEGAPAQASDPARTRHAQPRAGDIDPPEASGSDRAGPTRSLSERLQVFLASPGVKSDPQRWRQLLEDLPILDTQQRAMLEGSLARQLDAWLDSDTLPDPAILMVLNEEFTWDGSRSGLDEILDRPNAARIRTIISSLRR